MNTPGIVFLSLGILFIVVPSILTAVKRSGAYMVFSIFSILWLCLFPIVNYPQPCKDDVKDGKAIYIEEKNVGLNASGDTLYNYSTYHIEWLPGWKYGRKQK